MQTLDMNGNILYLKPPR